MTYGQFMNCRDGYDNRLKEQIKITDALNYSLGRYFCIAISGKSYPSKPFLADVGESDRRITNDEEYDKYIDSQIRMQGR